MKLATYNINGIASRLDNLLTWLAEARPDAVCLQEIKCTTAEFPVRALEAAGYGAIWRAQGPHHGVAILQRGATPLEVRRDLPGDATDRQARYLEAAIEGVLVACLYMPNGNPRPGPKFDYKLSWFERLVVHAEALICDSVQVVLAGDYNVVPTDADIYAMRSWGDNALVQPEPREAYARLLRQGWTDALGDLHPHEPAYTFWRYDRGAWQRDAGWRIDHLLVSPALLPRLWSASVDRLVRGRPNASDHAPVWIELT